MGISLESLRQFAGVAPEGYPGELPTEEAVDQALQGVSDRIDQLKKKRVGKLLNSDPEMFKWPIGIVYFGEAPKDRSGVNKPNDRKPTPQRPSTPKPTPKPGVKF
jgi:hypothetical protein